jgi:hypothetical protein
MARLRAVRGAVAKAGRDREARDAVVLHQIAANVAERRWAAAGRAWLSCVLTAWRLNLQVRALAVGVVRHAAVAVARVWAGSGALAARSIQTASQVRCAQAVFRLLRARAHGDEANLKAMVLCARRFGAAVMLCVKPGAHDEPMAARHARAARPAKQARAARSLGAVWRAGGGPTRARVTTQHVRPSRAGTPSWRTRGACAERVAAVAGQYDYVRALS